MPGIPDDIGDSSILQVPSYYLVDGSGNPIDQSAIQVTTLLMAILAEIHAMRTLDQDNNPL